MIEKSLYSKFRFDRAERVSDLLYNTKNVILNNTHYKSYLTEYVHHTQISSFKEPNKTIYPILQNSKYITLKKHNEIQTIETDTSVHSKKPSIRLKLASNVNLNDSDDEDNNFFLTTETSSHTSRRSVIPRRRYIYNKNKTNSILLLDIIFNDDRFTSLEYDESKIFHQEKKYTEYMRRRLVELKKEDSYDSTTNYVKKFRTTKGNLEMKFVSARMEIKTDSKTFIYEFPFAYLPLLYMNTLDNLKLLFVNLYNRDIFNDPTTTNEKIKTLFQSEIQNVIQYGIDQKGYFNLSHSNTDNKQIDKRIVERIHNKTDVEDEEDSIVKDIIMLEEMNTPIEQLTNLSVQREKKYEYGVLYTQSSKKFHFYWATKEHIYLIVIRMPEIFFKFKSLGKQINHSIDEELMIYLMMNNFDNWDIYCSHYLFSLKQFRLFIKSLLTKRTTINLNDAFLIRRMNNMECYTIRQTHFSKRTSMNDKQLSFLFTDKLYNNNHLFIFHSYLMYIYYPLVNKDKIFSFDFTFHQMKVLYLVSKKESLKRFILKILIIDFSKGDMQVDYSFFDLFYNKSLSEIEDFFKYINQKVEIKTKILGEEKPAQIDKLRIKVIFPYSEILTMKNTTNLLIANNDIWKLKQISIEESTMIKLLNSHIDNWVSIICQEEILEDTKAKNFFDDSKSYDILKNSRNKFVRKATIGRNKRGLSEHNKRNNTMYNKVIKQTSKLAKKLKPKIHQSITFKANQTNFICVNE